MEQRFGNGCPFFTDELGRKIDGEGFMTSSITYITNRRTCVSVNIGENVQVRNTEDKGKRTLEFSREEWLVFVEGVKKGEFDLV